MANQIFLDSDGVLFDFDSHFMTMSGGIHPRQFPDDELWKIVNANENFWITMPLMPGARTLLEHGKLHGPILPVVITGCPRSNFDFVAEQKKRKFKIYFPDIEIVTCLSRDKPLHMKNPGDILIDDFAKNIKRWEKAGGKGIRYYNYKQAMNELMVITENAK